jgi:hypothetical protein
MKLKKTNAHPPFPEPTRVNELSRERIVFLLDRMRAAVDHLPSNLAQADATIAEQEQTLTRESVPTGLIEQLFHPDPRIREELTEWCQLPVDALMCLAHDPSADVRYGLAANHNIADEVLTELTKDDNPYVWLRAQRTLTRKRRAENSAVLSFTASETKKRAQYA